MANKHTSFEQFEIKNRRLSVSSLILINSHDFKILPTNQTDKINYLLSKLFFNNSLRPDLNNIFLESTVAELPQTYNKFFLL